MSTGFGYPTHEELADFRRSVTRAELTKPGRFLALYRRARKQLARGVPMLWLVPGVKKARLTIKVYVRDVDPDDREERVTRQTVLVSMVGSGERIAKAVALLMTQPDLEVPDEPETAAKGFDYERVVDLT